MKCPHCDGSGEIDSVIHLPESVIASVKGGCVVGYDRLPNTPMPTGFNPDGTIKGVQPPTMDFPVAQPFSPAEEDQKQRARERDIHR